MKIALRVTWVVLFLAAVPAWAGSTTFTGAVSNDCDAPGAGNWSSNYPYGNETIIDNTGTYSNLTDANGWVSPSFLTLNRDGGATFDRLGTLIPDATGAGFTVKNAATYTIAGSVQCWATTTTLFDVAKGGVLNIGSTPQLQGAITFAGEGTTNIGDWVWYTWDAANNLNFQSAAKVSVSNTQQYGLTPISSMTGAAGTLKLTGGIWGFQANNYNFNGQLVVSAAPFSFAKFINADGSLASTVTGANINLAGRKSNNALLVCGGDQTFVNSTITGDGNIFCNTNANYSNQWGYGPFTTLTAKGCTIAPSNSGVAGTNALSGGASSNGQMVMLGNLVLDKDASGKNTQMVFAVTGTNGQLGADYTQLSIQYGCTINSASNIAAGGTNPLADADFVVNITKGLNNTALAGQTLKILEVNSTDLRTSTFGVTFVGGTGTVTAMHADAGWFPAWDDPNRVWQDATNWLELSNIVSAPLAIPGDANHSGLVDQDDYKVWYDNYGTGTTWEQGNFKGSGVTDQDDYKTWYDNYGVGTVGGAVPEPATMALLAMGALGLIRRKK